MKAGEKMAKNSKLFAYLTGATLTASSGMAGATLPVPVVDTNEFSDGVIDALTTSDSDGENEDGLDAMTARNDINDAVPIDVLESLLNDLSDDEIFKRRTSIVNALVASLRNVGGITRTRVVAEWTISDSPARRCAIAQVLSHAFYCLGSVGATAFLAEDPDERVRFETVGTAVSRMAEDPEHYRSLLKRLSADANRKTRLAAQRALGGLQEPFA